MTPKELSRIREIYERALSMSGLARTAYLDNECPNEEEIRREVEKLLAALENVPTWLDRPAAGVAKPFAAPPHPEKALQFNYNR